MSRHPNLNDPNSPSAIACVLLLLLALVAGLVRLGEWVVGGLK